MIHDLQHVSLWGREAAPLCSWRTDTSIRTQNLAAHSPNHLNHLASREQSPRSRERGEPSGTPAPSHGRFQRRGISQDQGDCSLADRHLADLELPRASCYFTWHGRQ